MTRRLPLLDRIEIPSPCPAEWDSMTGDNATRFCAQCSRSVHDLSSMTRRQAEGLVRRSGGRLCVRVTRDANGRTQTAERPSHRNVPSRHSSDALPPPFWLANPVIGPRASRTAASALALALLAVTPTPSMAQSPSVAASAQSPDRMRGTGSVRGVVADPAGAPVAGATVVLRGAQEVATGTSDPDGRFQFDSVAVGAFDLTVESAGFAGFHTRTFVTTTSEPDVIKAVLAVSSAGGMIIGISSKAHCLVWKVQADVEAESDDPVEEAPEPLLLSAIDGGEDELLEALDAGANANELFAFGRTPLMHAADDEDLVRLLLERGADPNRRDEGGATALHYAALSDDAGTVFALCRAGGDPNIADMDGVTPLIIAALDGSEETVVALLAAGANVHERDARGRSALDHAREEEHEDVIEILEVAGAR